MIRPLLGEGATNRAGLMAAVNLIAFPLLILGCCVQRCLGHGLAVGTVQGRDRGRLLRDPAR